MMERLSNHEKRMLSLQAANDATYDIFTPKWNRGTELVPELGLLRLGGLIYSGETSSVFAVKDRDLVIKYQCDTRSLPDIHPLIWDYWSGKEAAKLGLGPPVSFLSPGKRIAESVGDPKTRFTMSDAEREQAADRGCLVRFMVMDRVGDSLQQLIDRETRIPLEKALGYIIEIILKLSELHSHGIIHGDLHAGNVCFIRPRVESLTFIDFGFSSHVDDESDRRFRQPLSLMHHQYTPWELEGFRYARRDDVFKAFFLLGPLTIGEDAFWQGVPRLAQTSRQIFLHWKRMNNFVRTAGFDPVWADKRLSDSQKLDIERRLVAVSVEINSLHSVKTSIPYLRIVKMLSDVRSIITSSRVEQ
jgi:serine/threonine protein kinase